MEAHGFIIPSLATGAGQKATEVLTGTQLMKASEASGQIVSRRTIEAEWEWPKMGLLEVYSFLEVTIAVNYGVLCIITANGDFGR